MWFISFLFSFSPKEGNEEGGKREGGFRGREGKVKTCYVLNRNFWLTNRPTYRLISCSVTTKNQSQPKLTLVGFRDPERRFGPILAPKKTTSSIPWTFAKVLNRQLRKTMKSIFKIIFYLSGRTTHSYIGLTPILKWWIKNILTHISAITSFSWFLTS